MQSLSFKSGTAICKKNDNVLESKTKPYLSFEYDEINFENSDNDYFILSSIKNSITDEQRNEIISYIENVSIDENIELLNKLMNFLQSTDWMIIREMETGKKTPDHIKFEREEYRKRISEIKKIMK